MRLKSKTNKVVGGGVGGDGDDVDGGGGEGDGVREAMPLCVVKGVSHLA